MIKFFIILLCTLATPIKCSVIIIGAGASGIAAFSKLFENNITDVTILEAENRIGGRINTVKFGNGLIDMGAEWCQGQEGNIVYGMVKDFNILVDQSDPFKLIMKDVYIDADLQKQLFEIFDGLYISETEPTEDGVSTQDWFESRYNKSIHKAFGSDPNKLKIALHAMEAFEKAICSIEGAFSLSQISSKSDYESCPGKQLLSWFGKGYKTILDVMLKRYPDPSKSLPLDDHLILNKEVSKIIWSHEDSEKKGVTVLCSDGSKYSADTVIVTISLGVLKHNHKKIFEPSLPKSKVRLIESLGMDGVGKIWMHFNQSFWPKGNLTDVLMWSEEEKKNLNVEYPVGPIVGDKHWLSHIYSFFASNHDPNVLSAWIVGDMLPDIEKMSDEMVIDGVVYLLNRFYGDKYNNTRPDSVLRTKWYTLPNFQGTYSYHTLAARKIIKGEGFNFLVPLKNNANKSVVLFAGEATNPIHYATVHGAIETGFREANKIINNEL